MLDVAWGGMEKMVTWVWDTMNLRGLWATWMEMHSDQHRPGGEEQG